ncbi:formin-like protein 6 [Arachis stenosperma]|uniref:formin-like protein 6 n=1 Tax=Arachis stenosperma TaxID=217475 RepID=UPI0025AB9FCB|nr:formin-like protein 6 [Arachis stenosperma]
MSMKEILRSQHESKEMGYVLQQVEEEEIIEKDEMVEGLKEVKQEVDFKLENTFTPSDSVNDLVEVVEVSSIELENDVEEDNTQPATHDLINDKGLEESRKTPLLTPFPSSSSDPLRHCCSAGSHHRTGNLFLYLITTHYPTFPLLPLLLPVTTFPSPIPLSLHLSAAAAPATTTNGRRPPPFTINPLSLIHSLPSPSLLATHPLSSSVELPPPRPPSSPPPPTAVQASASAALTPIPTLLSILGSSPPPGSCSKFCPL